MLFPLCSVQNNTLIPFLCTHDSVYFQSQQDQRHCNDRRRDVDSSTQPRLYYTKKRIIPSKVEQVLWQTGKPRQTRSGLKKYCLVFNYIFLDYIWYILGKFSVRLPGSLAGLSPMVLLVLVGAHLLLLLLPVDFLILLHFLYLLVQKTMDCYWDW